MDESTRKSGVRSGFEIAIQEPPPNPKGLTPGDLYS